MQLLYNVYKIKQSWGQCKIIRTFLKAIMKRQPTLCGRISFFKK